MRIMLDTNIFISIAIFDSAKLKELLINICDNHILVLSSYIIKELEEVVNKKFPNKINNFCKFLYQLSYELNYTPNEQITNNNIKIRDSKDLPILNSAVVSDVDVFITGDRDFEDIDIEKPEIMTAKEFLEKYC